MRPDRETSDLQRTAVLTKALGEVARRLHIGPTEMGAIIGVSQATASRILKGQYQLRESAKEWELSAHLVRLYRSLFAMVGGDDVLAQSWLRSGNRAFADQAPIKLLPRVDGLIHVVEYLDAHRSRV